MNWIKKYKWGILLGWYFCCILIDVGYRLIYGHWDLSGVIYGGIASVAVLILMYLF